MNSAHQVSSHLNSHSVKWQEGPPLCSLLRTWTPQEEREGAAMGEGWVKEPWGGLGLEMILSSQSGLQSPFGASLEFSLEAMAQVTTLDSTQHCQKRLYS